MLTLAGRLVLLRRCLVLGRAALTAGRGRVGALVLLRRCLLLVGVLLRRCLLLIGAALTAGRGLASALVLLRRCLLLVCAALTAGRRLLAGALILLRRCLLRGRAALTGRGRLASALSTTLRAHHVRQSERRDGLVVDMAARLEALLPLERHQRLGRPRAQPSVRLPDVEPFLVQHDLHLADLLLSQVQCARSRSAAAELCSSAAGRPDWYDRDDLAAAVDDDDVVSYDEVLVSAPLRIDFDQRGRHVEHAHARRHDRSNAHSEIDVIHARYVAGGENGLLNLRALLRGQVHVATSLTLDLTLLGLTLLSLTLLRSLLLCLTLLSLTLLRSLLLRLTLLRGLTLLALLTLRSLTGGLTLLTALALLTLLALRGLTRGLITLLALATLLALTLLALALHALVALALLTLILLALLALVSLALLRLACGLLVLPLAALLGLTLLALILRSTLRLAAAALVAVRSCGAAFHLRAAARLTAGFATRHVLG